MEWMMQEPNEVLSELVHLAQSISNGLQLLQRCLRLQSVRWTTVWLNGLGTMGTSTGLAIALIRLEYDADGLESQQTRLHVPEQFA